jgi:hypothetical protein
MSRRCAKRGQGLRSLLNRSMSTEPGGLDPTLPCERHNSSEANNHQRSEKCNTSPVLGSSYPTTSVLCVASAQWLPRTLCWSVNEAEELRLTFCNYAHYSKFQPPALSYTCARRLLKGTTAYYNYQRVLKSFQVESAYVELTRARLRSS